METYRAGIRALLVEAAQQFQPLIVTSVAARQGSFYIFGNSLRVPDPQYHHFYVRSCISCDLYGWINRGPPHTWPDLRSTKIAKRG